MREVKNEDFVEIDNKLRKLPVLCAIIHNNKLIIIAKKRIKLKTKISQIILNPNQLRENKALVRKIIRDHIVLDGFEFFVNKVIKRGLR